MTLGRSSLTHPMVLESCRVAYACGLMFMRVEFQDEILLREENVKPRENSNFLKKGKMVISIKI